MNTNDNFNKQSSHAIVNVINIIHTYCARIKQFNIIKYDKIFFFFYGLSGVIFSPKTPKKGGWPTEFRPYRMEVSRSSSSCDQMQIGNRKATG